MHIITNDKSFTGEFFPTAADWAISPEQLDDKTNGVSGIFFHGEKTFFSRIQDQSMWDLAIVTKFAGESQFDVVVRAMSNELSKAGNMLCISGSGNNFHGFNKRKWEALPGNLHLTALLRPERKIAHPSAAFLVLPAVSVIQTIDNIAGLEDRTHIKWVNDLLIDEMKIAGVLAHSHLQGESVLSVAIGIGINVASKPEMISDSFVKGATCLNDYLPHNRQTSQGEVFNLLAANLSRNYELLLNGGYHKLLEFYKSRSLISGRNVKIMTDSIYSEGTEIIEGVVRKIGYDLEIYFENKSEPVTNGRLIVL